jgi:hypothetical protein
MLGCSPLEVLDLSAVLVLQNVFRPLSEVLRLFLMRTMAWDPCQVDFSNLQLSHFREIMLHGSAPWYLTPTSSP